MSSSLRLQSIERWGIAVVSFLLTWIGFRFTELRLNLDGLDGIPAAIAAFAVAVLVRRSFEVRPTSWVALAIGTLPILAASIFVFSIFYAGYTLPGHDPIAVPVLAQVIADDALPLEVYRPGTSAYSYPPGQPILMAVPARVVSMVDRVFALKIITLFAVALIPATWAWMHHRLFPARIRLLPLVAIAYLVFFGVERTLGFAIPFAGKNALLLGICLSPIAAATCVHLSRQRLKWTCGGFVLFGLVLINYSLLHMMAALLGAYAIVRALTGHLSWAEVFRIAGMGGIAAGLMYLLLNEALVDPRAAGFDFNFVGGLAPIAKAMIAHRSFMVIYMDAEFGISGFPLRGPALIVSLVLSVTISNVLRQSGLRDAAFVYALAWLIAMLFAFSVIPAGITPDFTRWFMWVFQAAMFLAGALALWTGMITAQSQLRYACAAIGVVAGCAASFMIMSDARVYRRVNVAQALSREDLARTREVLKPDHPGQPCLIIGSSVAHPAALVAIHPTKLLDYVEAATGCRFLNGSWIDVGTEESRAFIGFPSASFLQGLNRDASLFLITQPSRKDDYVAFLMAEGVELQLAYISAISGIPVWRVHMRRAGGE